MFSKTGDNTTFTVTLPATEGSSTKPSVITPVKDWESSFGQLSSAYGFNGGVPSLPKKSSPTSSSKPSGLTKAQTPRKTSKNWESSFGELSSSYGFGGGVPAVPERKRPKKTCSTKNSNTESQQKAVNPRGQLLEQYGFTGSSSVSQSRT